MIWLGRTFCPFQAKMQKEEITRIMENSKRNQKKAAKLIQKVTISMAAVVLCCLRCW